MSSHYRLLQVRLFNAQAVSSTTTYHSSPISILNLDNIGIQANITSTPTGTLSVEVSLDYAQTSTGEVTNTGTWVAISSSSTSIVSGSPTAVYYDLNQLSAPYVRLTYVNASGSGTLNAYLSGKGLI